MTEALAPRLQPRTANPASDPDVGAGRAAGPDDEATAVVGVPAGARR